MKNKYLSLLTQDPSLILRAVIIVAILFTPALFKKKILWQEQELLRLRQREQLITQIPELQKKIKILEEKVKVVQEKPPAKKIELFLNGIFIQDNKPVALINQNICYEFDSVEGFTVTKINADSVELKDNITQEQRTIFFPE